MKNRIMPTGIVWGWLGVLLLSWPLAAASGARADRVGAIFRNSCQDCHGGATPGAGLDLEPGRWFAATVNVASREKPDLKLIDPGLPDRSYLLWKVRGLPGIEGGRMPLEEEPLAAADLDVLSEWARSLDAGRAEAHAAGAPAPLPRRPAFWSSRLINLATTRMLGRDNFQFLVAHRFHPAARSGYDSFYGLNGPASVLVHFAYGISDRLEIMFGHTNTEHQFELCARWLLLADGGGPSRPFALALHGGSSVATQAVPGEKRLASGHFKFNLQLSASYQFSPRLTMLLVPAFASNVNHRAADPEGTFALGTGCKLTLAGELALIGQWVPVLSGFHSLANGWGAGLEYKIGRHVFQVFAVNGTGLIADQAIAGGDLLLRKGEFRFGFNLFREF